MAKRLKGKGYFVAESGYIYVQGSVNGRFKRKSTGLEATKNNIKYVSKNYRDLLLELCSEGKKQLSTDFATFARDVVAAGAKKPGRAGGRGELDQKNAISKLERLIIPFFKSYSIEEIKAVHVETWQDRLLAKGYSSSTVAKCRNLLRQIMHKAVANDLANKNPVDYAEKIAITHRKVEGYSIAEAKQLMAEAKGWFKLFLTLAFTTGMRTGELMALKWTDIDFNLGCIFLERSITKGRISVGNSGNKNHQRVVYLLPKVVDMLRAEMLKAGGKEWMFPSRSGKPYTEAKSITKRFFKPLLEQCSIEYKTLYATRHTFATIAANAMVNTQVLDAMVGNSKEVRDKHYITPAVTKEKVNQVQQALSENIGQLLA